MVLRSVDCLHDLENEEQVEEDSVIYGVGVEHHKKQQVRRIMLFINLWKNDKDILDVGLISYLVFVSKQDRGVDLNVRKVTICCWCILNESEGHQLDHKVMDILQDR